MLYLVRRIFDGGVWSLVLGSVCLASMQGEAKEFSVAEGFEAVVYAAPPEVNYPTCVAAGPGGEVFVAVDLNGSIDRGPDRGKIVRCVDEDGDGRADRFDVFADDVDSPRGLVVDGKRVYVLHPPYLSVFIDEDGDGVADRREVLVDGIGFDLEFRGADHTTNGIQLGVDGWIYIAVGDYGFLDAVGKDGVRLKMRGGGVVRVRTDGTEMEIYARGLRNIYDVGIDPYLNLFTRDNTNDGGGWNVRLSHIIDGAQYGYPTLYLNFHDEIMPALEDYGGGSPTGTLYLHEPGLPEGYGDALYTCDWGRNKIYRHPLEKDGATFEAEQDEFMQVIRPTDMDVDGQGRIYVSSWDGGRFTYDGPDVGYILRVQVEGSEGAPFPKMAEAAVDELVKFVAHRSATYRLRAQRELLQREPVTAAVEGLQQIAGDREEPLYARVAAIFSLKQWVGEQSHPFLLRLMEDGPVREFAMKALTDRVPEIKSVPVEPFQKALEDEDPRVRLQALISLRRLNAVEAAPAILALVRSSDRAIAHVAVKTLVGLNAAHVCLEAVEEGTVSTAEAGLRVLREMHNREVVEGLARALEHVRDEHVRERILATLVRLYFQEKEWTGGWWGTRPDTTGPYYDRVEWEESGRIAGLLGAALEEAAPGVAGRIFLELLRHQVTAGEQLQKLAVRVGGEPEIQRDAVEILSKQRSLPEQAVPVVKQAATAEESGAEVRARAFQVLQRQGERDERVKNALAVLGDWGDQETWPEPMREVWRAFVRDRDRAREVEPFVEATRAEEPVVRRTAWAVLAHVARQDRIREEWKEMAQKAIKESEDNPEKRAQFLGVVSEFELKEYQEEVLRGLESDEEVVRLAAVNAAGTLNLQGSAKGKDKSLMVSGFGIEEVQERVREMEGDIGLGETLFTRQVCVACHTVAPEETLKGPYLGGIGERYNRDQLVESIMNPSAQLAQGFETHWFELKNGERVEGFVVREAGNEVEVRNAAGIPAVIGKDQIAERGTTEISMMPEGLAVNLTVEELAALMEYLESL